MSDANRVAVRYQEEDTYGETPSSPDLTNVRFTSESLGQDSSTVTSQELRSDRQVADLVRTGLSGSGDINYEFSYGAFDDFIAAALFNGTAWVAAVTEVAGNSSSIASNVLTVTGADFDGDGYAVGQWVRMTGWSDAANNTYAKISVVGTTTMTLVGPTLVDEGPLTSVEVELGAQAVNGVTPTSFWLERQYVDITGPDIFAIHAGAMIDTWNLQVGSDSIVTGNFGFLTKSEVSAATSIDGTPTESAANSVMNGVDNVIAVYENSTAYDITSFNFTLTNNLRARLQVGTLGAISIGAGTVDVSGSIEAYFNDDAAMDRFRNDTYSDMSLVFNDTQGNAYVIDFPRVKYSNGRAVAGGINQDVVAALDFQAIREATEDVTIRVQRWDV